jgi:hypothetical protein
VPTTTKFLALAAGACIATSAAAQPAFYAEVTATHLPAGLAGPCMDAVAGDADGDGDLDLALAMEFQPNVLLLNDGAGVFTDASAQLPHAAHDSEDVAFADFDGDGDLDLVLVSEDDRTDELYLNDGEGRFTDASDRLATDDVSNALVVIDLNEDGAPDLLTGNLGTDRVLINDGRARFRDETASRWPQDGESHTQDLEAADFDGDGDLDVAVANEGQNQLFLNEAGRLVEAPASLPRRDDESREIKATDVDGDGDLDLAVANVRFVLEQSPQDYLLLNDGTGVFTDAAPDALPEGARNNFTIQVADLDRDGDVDVLAPSTEFPRSAVEFLLLVNDRSGRSVVVRAEDFDLDDVDSDGDLDVVIAGDAPQRILENDGGRLLVADGEASRADEDVLREMQPVDVDDDGDVDLGVAAVNLFTGAEAGLPLDGNQTFDIQVGDLGQDGDVDILARATTEAGSGGDYLVLRNDGSGRFSPAPAGEILPVGADGNGFDIEVADFDADGYPDLFFCNRASIPDPPAAAASSGGQQRLLLGRRPRE